MTFKRRPGRPRRRPVLLLRCTSRSIVSVFLDGQPLRLTPREREFVGLLAHHAQDPQNCFQLARHLDIDLLDVYRLVYNVRKKSGRAGLIERIGSHVTRGNLCHGETTYALAGVELQWDPPLAGREREAS
jgi:hypothetical protein